MSRNDAYRQKYRETVAKHLGQPVEAVEAVGVFSRPGSMGNLMLGKLSPLAAAARSRAAKAKTGGLPQNVVLAVTADRVYVFAYKPSGTKLKLKDPIAVWDRSQVRVEVLKEGMAANRLRVHLPDGDAIELDSNRMPGSSDDFNAPVLTALNR